MFREGLTNNVSAHKGNKMHVHLTIFGKKKPSIKSLKSDYFLIFSMYSFHRLYSTCLFYIIELILIQFCFVLSCDSADSVGMCSVTVYEKGL